MSGKSWWARNLIRYSQQLFVSPPQHVYYFYKADQDLYREMKTEFGPFITFIRGLPDQVRMESIGNSGAVTLVVIDDFGQELNDDVVTLFNITSHHLKVQVALLVHRLFSKIPHMRDISLAATHICLKPNLETELRCRSWHVR